MAVAPTGSVQRALSKIDGVGPDDGTLQTGSATVEADTERVTPGQIEASMVILGYQAKLRT